MVVILYVFIRCQPKKTKVCTDLNEEEEEAMGDWLGDHPELYNKKLNVYKYSAL